MGLYPNVKISTYLSKPETLFSSLQRGLLSKDVGERDTQVVKSSEPKQVGGLTKIHDSR